MPFYKKDLPHPYDNAGGVTKLIKDLDKQIDEFQPETWTECANIEAGLKYLKAKMKAQKKAWRKEETKKLGALKKD